MSSLTLVDSKIMGVEQTVWSQESSSTESFKLSWQEWQDTTLNTLVYHEETLPPCGRCWANQPKTLRENKEKVPDKTQRGNMEDTLGGGIQWGILSSRDGALCINPLCTLTLTQYYSVSVPGLKQLQNGS